MMRETKMETQYAIFTYKGTRQWARVLKVNKNGTVRVQFTQNWRETIRPEKLVGVDHIQAVIDGKGVL